MFKNFGKVFKFTFHNQVAPASYKVLTFVIGILLFLIPAGILVLLSMNANNDKDKKLESCGAEKIYVANTVAEGTDFNILKSIQGEGYDKIEYVTVPSVDDALEKIKAAGETKSFVLSVTKDSENAITADIVLPDGSEIKAGQAKHFYDAINSQTEMMFVITARGISLEDMAEVAKQTNTDLFNVSGFRKGESLLADSKIAEEQNNQKMLDGFSVIITMMVCMIMYFVVMAYGASITKNIVMEKSSKLMDTMLISVKPEAMIFGKLLGVLSAGLLQFFFWIAMLAGGVYAGVVLSDKFFPGANAPVITFLKSFGSLNLFKPGPVILAVIVLIFGILLYASLAAFAGAISSTQEQAASNQGIFLLVLIAAYFIVMIKALDPANTPLWIHLCPFTGALTLPAALVLGTLNWGTAIGGVAAVVVLALLLVYFAGMVYKAMALYKGQHLSPKKIFKIMTNK